MFSRSTTVTILPLQFNCLRSRRPQLPAADDSGSVGFRSDRAIMATTWLITNGLPQGRLMPSLFRFLVVVGLLFAVTAGGLYMLAELFEPVPKEVSQTVHGVKIRK